MRTGTRVVEARRLKPSSSSVHPTSPPPPPSLIAATNHRSYVPRLLEASSVFFFTADSRSRELSLWDALARISQPSATTAPPQLNKLVYNLAASRNRRLESKRDVMAPRQEAAPFVPISPTINIPMLVSSTPNFKPVQRVDARRINPTNIESLQEMIHEHVVLKGIPLVLENWHLRSDWQKRVFNFDWLKSNHGADQVNIRDIPNKTEIPMTLGHYLSNMAKLTSKFTPSNYGGQQQRLYGKDLDCPPVWRSSLANIIPESTFYLSSRADLMSSLPKEARAENMMCYVGHEGTYTPAHMEMCASLGQNIMIAASQDGANSEKGSSLWFMTQMADRDVVAEYWMGTLGHDLSIEAHFASLDDLRAAPFTVYVLEQRVGDYVLVPPLAPHQVWNRGTYTIKAAWNRTTVDTLEHALREALSKIRLVCRDEQYKTRAIIYDTLKNYTKVLARKDETELKSFPPTIKEDYIRLYNLFTNIMLDECFSPLLPKEKKVEMIPNDYNITCSFCRGNIFNRFLSCKRCPPSVEGLEDDPYDVCMDCYSRGRSCFCVSGLAWVEQHPWVELLKNHEKFRGTVVKILKEKDPENITEPPQFSNALANLNKNRKSLARVCQEALQARPYLDPNKIDDIDDDKEIAKKKREGKLLNCHTCGVRHPNWKAMLCTTKDCGKAYCFGNLWRAYDMDPFEACLAKHYWKCPVCLGICSCGRCRKKPDHQPYIPRGTILGAVTKHVADPRSIESLVDFGKGNVGWLINGVSGGKRKRGEDETEGGESLSKWGPTFGAPDTAEPDAVNGAMEQMIPEEFNDHNVVATPAGYKAHHGAAGLDVASIPIDPALGISSFSSAFSISKGESGDYVKMFENPPDVPNQYHRTTEAARAALELDSDDIEDSQRQLVRESDINPALTAEAPGFFDADEMHDSHHNYQSWNHRPHDAPTLSAGLSTLEQNPLAFLAAAGLMHSHHQEQGLVPTGEWANSYQDPYHYGGPALHPTETFESEGEQDAPAELYRLAPTAHYPSHIDPSLLANESPTAKPRKPGLSKKERKERVQGDIEFERVEHSGVAEWVKNMKSKKSRRKKGSLVVVLKISPEAWRRHDAKIAREKEDKANKVAAKFSSDEVATDLAPEPKRRRVDGNGATPKKARPLGSRKGYIDISEDEEKGMGYKELLSDDEAEVMPKKTSRSTRTGELVDGLTFEPTSRRTTLNKSSLPPSAKKGGSTPQLSAFMKIDIPALEDDASTPLAYDNDSSEEESPPFQVTAKDNANENEAGVGTQPGSEAYKAAIAKALQDAKRTALAAAEGRSPPTLSVYSSEAQSRAVSEEAEEDTSPTLEVAIESRKPIANDETEDGDSEDEDAMSPVRGDVKPSFITRNTFSKTPAGPKRKTPLKPSRQLSKKGRPGRPKKVDKDYIVPKTPAAAPKLDGFTPINPHATKTVTGSAKRGRPKRESVTTGTMSPDIDLTPGASPPMKRARTAVATPNGTPNRPGAINTGSRPRGRPKKSLSTPTGSVNTAGSPVPLSLPTSVGSKNDTPKKKPGRPPRSSLADESGTPKPNKGKITALAINPTSLDASRSRKVIELLRHSPPQGGEDEDDDWF
ncbi:hypothetical protein H072_3024 [Dactylellina haptotyla CBS 200.50]|uniref:JmjC domain-containing protein n=1 Tax=Dactylellina haptotyla (strain CBS 200.50) TaxID=1284197 RepID=S8AJA2_DACHA|nr:hypothetical protein H072_3024 [Dactylellina haptotyla CBS 200.50]